MHSAGDSSDEHLAARKPRVLMVTHRFPFPPNRGDRIRSYNILKVLTESFQVSLVCPHDEPVEAADLTHVRDLCEHVLTLPLSKLRWGRAIVGLIRGKSLTECLFSNPRLMHAVEGLQQEQPFDVAFVFCSSMLQFVDQPSMSGVPIVTDLVDVDSEKWRQMAEETARPRKWIYSMEADRVRDLEGRSADLSEAVLLVSDAEARLFESVVQTNTPVVGVSNGVDTEYFCPGNEHRDYDSVEHSVVPDEAESCLKLVFTGVLDYRPNVEGLHWFCREVWPELRKEVPVMLQVVGRRPTPSVLALNEIEGIEVVGEVPDVRPYLQAADLGVSPLKLARGIQNKVLEAMASQLPVVLTSQSAEGIAAESGKEFMIADSVEDWVAAIRSLWGDVEFREEMGLSARRLVVQNYGWRARLRRLIEILISSCK